MTNDRDRNLSAQVGSPVKRGRLPRWLKGRLRHEARRRKLSQGFGSPGDSFLLEFLGARLPWFDHWGMVSRNGRDCFVSEPYGLTDHHTREMLEFCRVLHLEFDIDATSFHYPTRTLRITMWPSEWGRPPEWDRPEGAAWNSA